jgi:hypothetical protein
MKHLKYPSPLSWAMAAWLALMASSADAAMHVEKSSASTPLEVVLSQPADKGKAEMGTVIITITNHSTQPVFLPRVRTPVENPEHGHQVGEILNVVDAQGKKARYTGYFVNYSFASSTELHLRIEPGQTLADEVDLSSDYDLKQGGEYRVSYEQQYGGARLLEGHIPNDAIESNTLTIWINSNLVGARPRFLDHGGMAGDTGRNRLFAGVKQNGTPWRPVF